MAEQNKAEKFVFYMYKMTKSYPPNKEVLKDISLSFYYGAKIGIIGQNGAGKSTLLRIMAGIDKEFQGEAWIEPGRTAGYLPQEPQLDPNLTVKENVMQAVAKKQAVLDRFNEISMKFAEPMEDDEMNKLLDEQAKLQDIIDAQDLWSLDRNIEIAMDALRCPPGDWPVTNLSGGEKRRVALCRLLLEEPDLLLLDEPTNHLDAETVAWLERHLREYKGSVILVTHDRYFLDNVTNWILEIDRGRGIPWEGNYAQWLDQKLERMKNEEKGESDRQKRLAREQEWVKQSPKARQAKSKARLKAYEELLAEDSKEQIKVAQIHIANGKRLGDVVIQAEHLQKAFGEKVLFDDLNFSLPRSGIVGIIGPNGAGKTTLFKMIMGQEKPDGGTLKIGETVEIISMEQGRESLDDSKTVWESITGGNDEILVGDRKMNGRAYCGLFNFTGAAQQKKLSQLSGGERNRVLMAKNLQKPGNLLFLDEPTNDLDIETLQALEQAILKFAGCAVIISHDRWFLDRIATHILAYEGDSKVVWFEGNWSEYEADRRKRLGEDADNPKPIKYKTLTRQ
ncbi:MULTISPECIES: energy-dependent translational throttle protein EttA [Fibrobacter]|jgi:ATP-binding cassette ChvD family protein|uniref:energy-dependent translational throttle protein EttA n=1 Tax=Fibrobacter TaxID=832 RepID=UPI00092353F0|nr:MULTISPECIES: energy-dependent translational throttle protein EttA [Fibrobacter]MBP5440394.1 energy-dependent translational throttle protein EttA [Fibrobacter sp.]OWV21283.1 energy-dependent translational throttle protein EttA [Fibrobacter sp. UWB3]SHK42734.1 ATP-binding cassette protein, ChvD family [Fibrobacter sp. UWB12]SOD12456.1 ATP-binding cassette protein, ChvD family [Fibrobacter sp. UWB16]